MIYTSVRWIVRSFAVTFALVISASILISGCKPSAVLPAKATGTGVVPEKSATETTTGKSVSLPA